MNCGVDYEDSYWVEQLAVTKQPATMNRIGVLKNSKPNPDIHASAQECVGQAGSLKDLNHGSRIVTCARWGQSRAVIEPHVQSNERRSNQDH